MSTWTPGAMPKVRDQTATELCTPDSVMRRKYWPGNDGEHIDRIGRDLAVSDLYWATPDMAGLAVASAGGLDEVRWTAADRPSMFGLLIWEGGVSGVDWPGVDAGTLPATAVSWAPHPDGLLVTLWVARQVAADWYTRNNPGRTLFVNGLLPPLMPAISDILPLSDQFTPVGDLDKRAPGQMMPVVYATWQLMQQRGLVDRRPAVIEPKLAKAYARKDLAEPEVTIVTLRRRYVPDQCEPAPVGEPAGRHFSHRWVVEGFWRNQRYGPGLTLIRKRWISAFIKGPADKPLLVKTRVNVWRR